MPADIADDLRNHGEDEVRVNGDAPAQDQLERLFELAAVHAQTGMLFAEALALAAIEVVEGHPRALRRERRKLFATEALVGTRRPSHGQVGSDP